MSKNILIIEDEDTLRESLKRIFARDGFSVEATESAETGLKLLDVNHFDVIISDIMLPGIDGIEFLQKVRELLPDQMFIVITAYASLETAIKALRAGAYDYIMKPIMHEEIKQVVRNALRQKRLESENSLLRREIARDYDFSNIIGESRALQAIVEQVKKIADTRSNVLLLGETGTGKELFARVIHHSSSRKEMPFVPINCSAIPEHLLESELFGHVKGAFTGAVISKKGLFEEADGGTVFLDEIGDISPALQVKLLRVLEDQLIRPVGSTKAEKVDTRYITATNRNLGEAVKRGAFREDLYYRINTISMRIPPLRERRDDIPLLVHYYVSKYSKELGKAGKEIDPSALDILENYDWPGNIRELQNVIERAILISDGNRITADSLPDMVRTEVAPGNGGMEDMLSIEEYTKAFISKFQDSHTEQQLADLLGITRKSLWEKRKKWGMKR